MYQECVSVSPYTQYEETREKWRPGGLPCCSSSEKVCFYCGTTPSVSITAGITDTGLTETHS